MAVRRGSAPTTTAWRTSTQSPTATVVPGGMVARDGPPVPSTVQAPRSTRATRPAISRAQELDGGGQGGGPGVVPAEVGESTGKKMRKRKTM